MWHNASGCQLSLYGTIYWTVAVVFRTSTNQYAISNSNDATVSRSARPHADVGDHSSVESGRKKPRRTVEVEWHRGVAGSEAA